MSVSWSGHTLFHKYLMVVFNIEWSLSCFLGMYQCLRAGWHLRCGARGVMSVGLFHTAASDHSTSRGHRICNYFWPAMDDMGRVMAQPKGVISVLHGHGTYLCFQYLKLDSVGRLPVYEGFAVCGIDSQGAGRSEGLRAYTASFKDLVDDVITHNEMVVSCGLPGFKPQAPRFVMGCSMGGCLALMATLEKAGLFAGCILLAPMLSLEKLRQRGVNRVLAPVGALVSAMLPTLPVAATTRNTLTGNTRARNAMEFLRVTSSLMQPGGMEAVTVPLLIFHGCKDTMCDIDGSK
ncbi:hydrolase_4 domain-containing protein, partial [Haematococcus lacustris]